MWEQGESLYMGGSRVEERVTQNAQTPRTLQHYGIGALSGEINSTSEM